MANSAKRRGDRAEREVCALLADLTGYNVKRALGAGRAEDVGDAFGLPGAVIQVVDWKDVIRAVREKPITAEAQRLNAGVDLAWTAVRLRGGVWRFVQTPEQAMCAWRLSI